MNDEIKEILDKLEIVARKHTIEVCEDGSKIETMPASVVDELRLNNYSAKILLDYITNLQERIDKAVEYIENNSHSNIKMNFIDESGKIKCKFDNNTDPRDLLDILEGSDKE